MNSESDFQLDKSKQYALNFLKDIDIKLTKVSILKDYAVEKGFDVPDTLLQSFNIIKLKIASNQMLEVGGDLDGLIRDFSQITSPATFESIYSLRKGNNGNNGNDGNFQEIDDVEKFNKKGFYKLIIILSFLSILIGILSYILIKKDISSDLSKSILSVCMGLLGSIIYTIFNLIGEIKEKTFNPEDKIGIYLRIIVGPLLGWLFFIAFSEEAFNFTETDKNTRVLIFLPFLVGFSTRLVIGFFAKLANVVELALGIQDIEIQKRKKRLK